MKFHQLLLVPFCLLGNRHLIAQSLVEGVWRGTSICQIKNSPCHDETVAYHISKDAEVNHYKCVAYKIVNGTEDNMGEIVFTYDSVKATFISHDTARNVVWDFRIKGRQMSGKLILRGDLYRVVEIKKDD